MPIEKYPCKIDQSLQNAIVYRPDTREERPLVVCLHTWSFNCENADCSDYLALAQKYAWNMIFPDFRGPNWTPQACGSDAVVSDVADAVAYMKRAALVDNDRIYLMGGSGGGHCSLLMASRRPELWTAVSAWCAISDVAAWHDQCVERERGYSEHIEKACGGDPSKDASAKAEAARRSPMTYMAAASRVVLDINAGIHDGHNFDGRNGSVPVSQSLWAFNALAKPADRISEEDIDFITAEQKIPEKFGVPEADPAFAEKPIHFRRQSNLARITIFEGGHDCVHEAGLDWLAKQNRKSAADWSAGKAVDAANAELDK